MRLLSKIGPNGPTPKVSMQGQSIESAGGGRIDGEAHLICRSRARDLLPITSQTDGEGTGLHLETPADFVSRPGNCEDIAGDGTGDGGGQACNSKRSVAGQCIRIPR